ncbi:MAG TPA: hypothetical protein VK659_24450 [Asanoa sp.]|nr:hypothetical protein [Asanoa sp.]
MAGILADVLLGKAFRRGDPAAAAVVRSSFIRADRAGMRQAIRSISLDRPDATGRLAAIKAPTLMATGADDPMCTPADISGWVALMPAGRDLVLPGAGQLTPLFDPDTAGVITEFWSSSGSHPK